jgi:hypothetical protein
MPLRHKYTLVCDDVRVENNNKLFVIGLYAGIITVPQIPFVLQSLSFAQAFEDDRPEQLQFRATLQHLDSGLVLAQAMGMMGIAAPGQGMSVIKFAPLQINQVGGYVFAVTIDGVAEPITTNFDVRLNPQPQVMPFNPTQRR